MLHADGVSTPPHRRPGPRRHPLGLHPGVGARTSASTATARYAHALGPMQFIPSTWAALRRRRQRRRQGRHLQHQRRRARRRPLPLRRRRQPAHARRPGRGRARLQPLRPVPRAGARPGRRLPQRREGQRHPGRQHDRLAAHGRRTPVTSRRPTPAPPTAVDPGASKTADVAPEADQARPSRRKSTGSKPTASHRRFRLGFGRHRRRRHRRRFRRRRHGWRHRRWRSPRPRRQRPAAGAAWAASRAACRRSCRSRAHEQHGQAGAVGLRDQDVLT